MYAHAKCHRFMALFLACLPLSPSLLMCFPTLPCAGRKTGWGKARKETGVAGQWAGMGASKQAGKEAGKEQGRRKQAKSKADREAGKQGRKQWASMVGKHINKQDDRGRPRRTPSNRAQKCPRGPPNVIVSRHRFTMD